MHACVRTWTDILAWLRRHDNPLRPISKFQERKVAYRWHHFPGGEVMVYLQEDQAARYPPPLSRFVDLKRQEGEVIEVYKITYSVARPA
ncbi:hypothetical protein PAHAL_2G078300 [Panicum hallii]|uniref:Uncharacterized protein n=1 Tax=Panicum hallii TaxID=206008 RepID=A0A2T8KNA0_9POAL|nr:hypothetical protein PAHAL_2G078300 [Panicum hallii]